ncbi:MAG: septum formation initiator family protein [Bacteroidia bacterium]|nr:septum formation initiator family protein [Bacteroidia bacterium]
MFKNIFVLIFVVFAVWMLFFDTNSLLTHLELNNEIDDLENEKDYYQREIKKDKKEIKKLSDSDGLEKFAREKYYMKKENEEIYIIEYEDSIVKQTEDE